MDLKEFITKRKSTRKYDMTPLSEEKLAEINSYAGNLKPLYPNIKVELEFTDNVKNLLPVKAPYYIIIRSEKIEGYLINVGFMFQQMDLYLSSQGLGSCWLGMARPIAKTDGKLEFVIVLAFGKAADSPYRELSEFRRKPLSEVSTGNDERLGFARLAPSATNSQNWFFVAKDGKINVYKKKLNKVIAITYEKMNTIDIGIALAHIYVAGPDKFVFAKDSNYTKINKYEYIGTVGE